MIKTPQTIADNCSVEPLGAGETFTGKWNLCEFFPSVTTAVKTDQDGTLYLEFSPDGENADGSLSYGVSAGINDVHRLSVTRAYYRVRFTNTSASAQTYFRLQTIFGNQVNLAAPVNLGVQLDADATVVRPTSFQDEVVIGRRTGITPWTKFGYRTTLTSAGGEQTIWATTGNYTIPTSSDTYTITYDGTGGGSTDGAGTTGALILTIVHIDQNGLPETFTHTLGTDGSDVTVNSGLGINRVAVSSSGSANHNVSNITITHTSSGNTMAFIPATQSVTQQAIFHVGSNHSAIAKYLTFNVNKLSGSNPKVTVKGYVFNRGISTDFEVYRHIIDTQSETTVTVKDPVGFKLNATDVLYFVADTDQNNTVITMRFSLNEYQNA